MAIANLLGKIVALEDFWNNSDKRMERVLELDLRGGLPTKLEIEWENWYYSQKLDFWRLPFH